MKELVKSKEAAQKARADVLLEAADMLLDAGPDKEAVSDKVKDALNKSKQLKGVAESYVSLDARDRHSKMLERAKKAVSKNEGTAVVRVSPKREPLSSGPAPLPPERYGDEMVAKVAELAARRENLEEAAEKFKELSLRQARILADSKVEMEMAEDIVDGKQKVDSMEQFYESVRIYKDMINGQAAEAAAMDQKQVEEDRGRSRTRIKVGTSASHKKLEARRLKLEERRLTDLENSHQGDLVVFTARQREDSRKAIEEKIKQEYLEALHGGRLNPAVYIQQMAESIRYQTQHLLEVLKIWPHLDSCEILVGTRGKDRKEYSTVELAVKDGFKLNSIQKCLNGESKTHKGYKWEWTQQSIL